jgi:hypothetical protein
MPDDREVLTHSKMGSKRESGYGNDPTYFPVDILQNKAPSLHWQRSLAEKQGLRLRNSGGLKNQSREFWSSQPVSIWEICHRGKHREGESKTK